MRVFCLILAAVFFPSILYAGQIADLEFRGLRFGQRPHAEMICVKGPCYFGRPGENIEKKTDFPFCSYKLPVDITHLGRTEITVPKYDYYLDRLFQVSFKIQCDPDEAEFCMESVWNALDGLYGLTLVKTINRGESALQSGVARTYLTDSGALVEIYRFSSREEWNPPLVKIYEQNLMDELRLAVNPDYIPSPFR